MASSVTTSLSAISAVTSTTTNNNNNVTTTCFDTNDIKVDITSPMVDEETADEVKVFRSNTNDDDPNELAGSSADLNADKQELALEADIESQADFTQQHVNPIVNPFTPLPWPSPGSNFMFNQLLALSSPVYAAAHQKLAAAAIAQVYSAAATAALVARHSPNYFNFGAQFGAAPSFEHPPSFSIGQPQCTTPSNNNTSRNNNNNNCFNFQQHHQQLGSPMTSLGGVFGNICLNNDSREGNSSSFKQPNNLDYQKQQQQQHLLSSADKCYIDSRGQLKTPKLETAEHHHGRIKEKRQHNGKNNNVSHESKKEHIKKPMNAFMLFMKENRHKYMDETSDRKKQSAELNKELGQIWQKMSKDEQQPYYEMAQQKREEHQQLYPNWTARENYAIHKKAKRRRTRERSFENNEQKKCRARFGVDNQAKWCKHCRRKKRCLNVCDSSSPIHQN